MKKFTLAIMMMLSAAGFAASASDHVTRDVSVLPQAALQTLHTDFAGQTVSFIKVDRDLGRISEYDVVLDNGTEVNFTRSGQWKEVDTARGSSVPQSMVPEAIASYVSRNIPKARIVGLERHRRGYDVELSNGVDMKFDAKGKFLRYDD